MSHPDRPKVSELQAALSDRTLQLASVQRNYEALSRIISSRQGDYGQMSESLTAERAQSAVLQQQLKEMQQRTERAEERLSNLLQLPTALIELQLQMESLQKESTDTLTKHNTIAERLTSAIMELEGRRVTEQQLREQLTKALDAERRQQEAANGLQALLAVQRMEADTAKDGLKTAHDSLARVSARLSVTEEELKSKSKSCAEAEEQLQDERNRARRLQAELTTARSAQTKGALKLMETQTQQQQLEQQLHSITEQAEQLKKDLASTSEDLEFAQEHKMQLTHLLTEAQRVRDEQADARQALDNQCLALKAQVNMLQRDLTDTQHSLKEVTEVAARQQSQLSSRLVSVTATAERQEQELITLRFRYLEGMTKASASTEGLLGRLDAVQQALVGSTRASETQEAVLQEASGAFRLMVQLVEDAERRIAALSGPIELLQQRYDARTLKASSDKSEAASLRKAIRELEGKADNLQAALRQKQSALDEAHDANGVLQADRNAMAGQLAAAQAKMDQERMELLRRCSDEAAAAAALERSQGVAARAELQAGIGARDAELVLLKGSVAACWSAVGPVNERLAEMRDLLTSVEVDGADDEMAATPTGDHSANGSSTGAAAGLGSDRAAGNQQQQQQPLEGSSASAPTEEAGRTQQQPGGVDHNHSSDGTTAAPSAQGSEEGMQQSASGNSKAATSEPGRTSKAVRAVDAMHSNTLPAEGDESAAALAQTLDCMHAQADAVWHALQLVAKHLPQLRMDWLEQERELSSTFAKLLHVEQSSASNYSCLACLGVFKNPVVCVPCGHTWCRRCLDDAQGICRECGAVSTGNAPNLALDRLCSKYDYKCTLTAALRTLTAKRNTQPQTPTRKRVNGVTRASSPVALQLPSSPGNGPLRRTMSRPGADAASSRPPSASRTLAGASSINGLLPAISSPGASRSPSIKQG